MAKSVGPKSKISDPAYAMQVAELYMSGMTQQAIADELGHSRETVNTWVNDDRVKAHAAKIAQERVNIISRRLDREMERRMQDADELDTELLLKIRKEYLGSSQKVLKDQAPTVEAVNDAMTMMEDNEDFAEQLAKLTGKS